MKVFPNLEMGDNIVLNGLCRYLARRHSEVVWATSWPYSDAIAKMFSDLPNVRIENGHAYPLPGEEYPSAPEMIRIGYFNPEKLDWTRCQWDQSFYAQAGVDFSERWTSFKLPADMLVSAMARGVLTHSLPERGIRITRPIPEDAVFMGRRNSFWDWLPEMLSASQLHLVDSSYLNLAESLWALGLMNNTELYFHAYAKKKAFGSVPPILKGPWVVYE